MSDQIKVLLPKLGESIHSATIVQWFKNVGDEVRLDEPLLEVSTDKVNSEIPSPVSGILTEIHARINEELQVGALIALIAPSSSSQAPILQGKPLDAKPASQEVDDMKGVFSPSFLRIAQEQGIGMEEMQKIPGTGMGGRITKNDLEGYIEKKRLSKSTPCPLASPKTAASADVERLKMSGMRKAIADNMVRSFYGAPHASLVVEVDVTAVLKQIAQDKQAFMLKTGSKLTITAFIAKAITLALKEYPLINSSLEEDTILVKRFVNLGIAVSVDQGLMVPVIKQAQEMTIPELAQAIGEISVKARSGKLSLDDVKEGTITITNFGMSGVQIGIPIIRYPEVAILGIGAICKKVVPLDNDELAIRSTVHISLTFDHRVLDGMYGCGFLGALKKHLELKTDCS
jgi:2-oxoglutarate dehydrogenase E2 component (dihydrolipoamide succinyltransferase)